MRTGEDNVELSIIVAWNQISLPKRSFPKRDRLFCWNFFNDFLTVRPSPLSPSLIRLVFISFIPSTILIIRDIFLYESNILNVCTADNWRVFSFTSPKCAGKKSRHPFLLDLFPFSTAADIDVKFCGRKKSSQMSSARSPLRNNSLSFEELKERNFDWSQVSLPSQWTPAPGNYNHELSNEENIDTSSNLRFGLHEQHFPEIPCCIAWVWVCWPHPTWLRRIWQWTTKIRIRRIYFTNGCP